MLLGALWESRHNHVSVTYGFHFVDSVRLNYLVEFCIKLVQELNNLEEAKVIRVCEGVDLVENKQSVLELHLVVETLSTCS